MARGGECCAGVGDVGSAGVGSDAGAWGWGAACARGGQCCAGVGDVGSACCAGVGDMGSAGVGFETLFCSFVMC